jgi:preprotein translocase subunit SecY
MKILRIDTLTRRIFFTVFILIFIRVGNFIPIPNIDQYYLVNILNSNPSLKTFFNNETLILSIFTLGIIPSINASILMQLLTNVIPTLETLQKEEGEAGRRKIKQYTRILTLILAIGESLTIVFSLRPIIFNWNISVCGEITLALTTGSMIVLWLSDLITENGIGNGSSIIITLNVLSILPNTIKTIAESGDIFTIAQSLIGFTLLMSGVIFVQGAVRTIPLISAKQLLAEETNKISQKSVMPLRVNQGGVMPVIFSSTFISFLTTGLNYILSLQSVPSEITAPKNIALFFGIINFLLIFVFSRFYSNLILNPKDMSKNLNKMSVAIPGIRPGKQTAEFLRKTLNRLSFLGSIFLAVLVAIPNVRSAYGFGVTSIIILVGVIIDTGRQIQTLLISQKY